MKDVIGEKIIAWKITPEIYLSKIKIVRKIVFIPYFSIIFSIFGKLYVDSTQKQWAFIILLLLTIFYVYIFYFYKRKQDVEYLINDKGLTIKKGAKKTVYNWEDFRRYYNNKEVTWGSGDRRTRGLDKALKSIITVPIFTLLMKNQFKKWGQISIVPIEENHREIEQILNSKLYKTNKVEPTLSIWLLGIMLVLGIIGLFLLVFN